MIVKHVKKGIILLLVTVFPLTGFNFDIELSEADQQQVFEDYTNSLYTCFADADLNFNAFKEALKGLFILKNKNLLSNTNILTLIDYSLSANIPRFFVLDIDKGEVLYKTLVSHGKKSGEEFAVSFSNKVKSYKSCIGFFLTAETFFGDNGFSLRLDGIEEGVNDNARERSIVIHGANYVSGQFIQENGRLGRSRGCPALPFDENYACILDIIKDKTCLFAYYPDTVYLRNSKLLNPFNYLQHFAAQLYIAP